MAEDTDMKHSDSLILARIDERTKAHTTDFAQHVRDDGEKFEKVFSFVTKRFDKMDERFDNIDKKLEPLQNESNQRKGAVAISKMISMAAYSCIALAAGWFGGGVHK